MFSTLRILLVDDEPCMREEILPLMLEALLSGWWSVTITTAGDVPATRSLLEEGRSFDLALIDRRLPGGDGMELIGELRRLGLAERIIFMSGSAPDVLEQGVRAGANAAIQKPFDMARLRLAFHQLGFLN